MDGLLAQHMKLTAVRILAAFLLARKPLLFRTCIPRLEKLPTMGKVSQFSVLIGPQPLTQVRVPLTRTLSTLNRRQLDAIVISCTPRTSLILRERTATVLPIPMERIRQNRPRRKGLGMPLRNANPSGRGAASSRPQPPDSGCLSGPATTEDHPWMPPPYRQPLRRPVRTTGIYPGSKCAAYAPRRPSSRRHRLKRP